MTIDLMTRWVDPLTVLPGDCGRSRKQPSPGHPVISTRGHQVNGHQVKRHNTQLPVTLSLGQEVNPLPCTTRRRLGAEAYGQDARATSLFTQTRQSSCL